MSKKQLMKALHLDVDSSCEQYDFSTIPRDFVLGQYCKTLNPKKIKYVSGVMSFTKLELDGSYFYIFGANHTHPRPCNENYVNIVNISGLVESLVKYNPDILYDFYYEHYYTQQDHGIISYIKSFFGTTIKRPTICIDKALNTINYSLKKTGNLRIHYADYRSFYGHKSDINTLYHHKCGDVPNYKKLISNFVSLLDSPKLKRQYTGNIHIYNFIRQSILQSFNNLYEEPRTVQSTDLLDLDSS